MKRLLIGALFGIVAVCIVILVLMSGGSPFRTVTLKYGAWRGSTVVVTPDFTVIYENFPRNGGGASAVTIAGQDGSVPAFWRGYGAGWHGDEKGIGFFHDYNPRSGTATIFLDGKLLIVDQDGSRLRVQNGAFALGHGPVIVAVGADGLARQLTGTEAADICQSLDPWFKKDAIEAFPLAAAAAPRPATQERVH